MHTGMKKMKKRKMAGSVINWIPVERGLPAYNGEFLITYYTVPKTGPYVTVSQYSVNRGFIQPGEIVAWAEKPCPFSLDKKEEQI